MLYFKFGSLGNHNRCKLKFSKSLIKYGCFITMCSCIVGIYHLFSLFFPRFIYVVLATVKIDVYFFSLVIGDVYMLESDIYF